MIEKQSKQIRQFYLAYKKWLDDGAPEYTKERPLMRDTGLCGNLINFMSLNYTGSAAHILNACEELRTQFEAYGLDRYYPFHFEDRARYEKEYNEEVCHLNPDRIEWVTMMCEISD